MRKLIPLLSLVLLIVFVFASSALYDHGYTVEIRELNANSNFDFKLAKNAQREKKVEGYGLIGGFGCYTLVSRDLLTEYLVAGYPDCLDSYKIVAYETQDPRYLVYGVGVGKSLDKVCASLETHQYVRDIKNSRESCWIYTRGKVNIWIFMDGCIVSKLAVRLTTTNIRSIVF